MELAEAVKRRGKFFSGDRSLPNSTPFERRDSGELRSCEEILTVGRNSVSACHNRPKLSKQFVVKPEARGPGSRAPEKPALLLRERACVHTKPRVPAPSTTSFARSG